MPTLNWDCGVISCLFWECQIIWIREGAKKAPGSSILRHKKQQSRFFFLWYWPALKAAVAFSWCKVSWYTVQGCLGDPVVVDRGWIPPGEPRPDWYFVLSWLLFLCVFQLFCHLFLNSQCSSIPSPSFHSLLCWVASSVLPCSPGHTSS